MPTTQAPAPKKPVWKSKNFWTGIATILAAAFAYFGVTVDTAAAATLTDGAQTVTDAVETKNWLALGVFLLNSGNVLFHLFKTWFANK